MDQYLSGVWIGVIAGVVLLIVWGIWKLWQRRHWSIVEEGRELYGRLRWTSGEAAEHTYNRLVKHLDKYPWLQGKKYKMTKDLAEHEKAVGNSHRIDQLVGWLEHGGVKQEDAEAFLAELELLGAEVDRAKLRKQFLATHALAKIREKEGEFSRLWREVSRLAEWQDRDLTPEQVEPFRRLKTRLDQALPSLEEAAAQAGLIHKPVAQ